MSKLIPDYVFDSIYDITPELLEKHGVYYRLWNQLPSLDLML